MLNHLINTYNPNFNIKEKLEFLLNKGKTDYGNTFQFYQEDYELLFKLITYIQGDKQTAEKLNLNLKKGILLTGPVGVGKTTIMKLMRYLQTPHQRQLVIPCRDISFQFMKEGYETILHYSNRSYKEYPEHGYIPVTYCFDDLGIEQNLKFYGNECNVMAEILLSRYDRFIKDGMLTHITTNLSATEIEEMYGNRVRSRMRQMFNLVSFDKDALDKRF